MQQVSVALRRELVMAVTAYVAWRLATGPFLVVGRGEGGGVAGEPTAVAGIASEDLGS